MYTKKNKRRQQRGGVSEAATALGRAVQRRSLAEVQRVLEKYPDMDLNEAFPLSSGYLVLPINDALLWGQYNIARFLIEKGADVNRMSPNGALPLHTAAGKDTAMTQYLLDHGADINKEEAYGQTALHKAVFSSNLGTVTLLIERGANVNARNSEGFTPLNGNISADITNELIKHGADVNTKTDFGMTPLHWSAAYAKVEQANYLLDNGADVNAPNESQQTPLMMAVDPYEGDNVTDPAFIRLLIEYGADETKRDNKGRTVTDYLLMLSRHNPATGAAYRKVLEDALRERARRANIRSKARTLRNVHLGLNSSVLPRNIVGHIGTTLTGVKTTGNIPNTLKTLKKNYNKKG